MFCTHCGKELPDDARFCTGCGNAVTPANTPQQSSAPAEAKTPAPCKKVYEEQQETGGTGKTIWNLLMLLTSLVLGGVILRTVGGIENVLSKLWCKIRGWDGFLRAVRHKAEP